MFAKNRGISHTKSCPDKRGHTPATTSVALAKGESWRRVHEENLAIYHQPADWSLQKTPRSDVDGTLPTCHCLPPGKIAHPSEKAEGIYTNIAQETQVPITASRIAWTGRHCRNIFEGPGFQPTRPVPSGKIPDSDLARARREAKLEFRINFVKCFIS